MNKYTKVIAASAGTGKTYRLSLEFISLLLLNPDCQPQDITVITFTRKATAEIYQRLLEHLHQLATNNAQGLADSLQQLMGRKLTSADYQRLQQVHTMLIGGQNQLRVSTIDALVNQIFAGFIGPYYNLGDYQIDPDANRELASEILAALLEDDDFDRFKDVFATFLARGLEEYKDFVTTLIQNRWLFFMQEKQQQPDWPKAHQHLQQSLQLLQQMWGMYQGLCQQSKPFNPAKDLKKDWQNLLFDSKSQQLLTPDEALQNETLLVEKRDEILYIGLFMFNSNTRLRGKAVQQLKQDLQDIAQQAFDNLIAYYFYGPFMKEQNQLTQLAGHLLNAYDHHKLTTKVFTYDDILFYTLNLLQDQDLAFTGAGMLNLFYERLSQRIRFLLIDEFQDTSVVQWKILYPLIEELTAGSGIYPTSGVVLVGDEKQAIYGFRGGERELLLQAPKVLGQGAAAKPLTTSWRTDQYPMQLVNQVFSSLSQVYSPGIAWPYTQVDCQSHTPGYAATYLLNRKSLEFDNVYHWYTVNVIVPFLQKYPQQNVAILAAKNKELDKVAVALTAQGIEVLKESALSITKHPAITPIILLLNWLVNNDELALAGFLRSDPVLFSALQTAQWVQLARSNKTELLAQEHPMAKVLALAAKATTATQLVLTCYNNLGYKSLFVGQEAALHQYLQLANMHDTGTNPEGPGIAAFAAFNRRIDEAKTYQQPAGSKGVRLISVHKSKGLEFDTVFYLSDFTPAGGQSPKKLHTSYSFNSSFTALQDCYYTLNWNKLLPLALPKLQTRAHTTQVAESLNRHYVALTRTKHNLVLLGHYSKKGDIADIEPDTPHKQLLKVVAGLNGPLPSQQELAQNGYLHWQKGAPWVPAAIEQQPPVQALPIFKLRQAGAADTPNITDTNQQKAMLLGSAAHAFLGEIAFDSPSARSRAKTKLYIDFGSLLSHGELNLVEHACIKLIDTNQNYFCKGAYSQAWCEYPLYDKKGQQHRPDRVLINPQSQELLVLDYKTGSITEQGQLQRYLDLLTTLPAFNGYNMQAKFLPLPLF